MFIKLVKNLGWKIGVFGCFLLGGQAGLAAGQADRVIIQVYDHEYGSSRQAWFRGDSAKDLYDILSLGSKRKEMAAPIGPETTIIRYTGTNIRCEERRDERLKHSTYSCFSRIFLGNAGSGEEIPASVIVDQRYDAVFLTARIAEQRVLVTVKGSGLWELVSMGCHNAQKECSFELDGAGNISRPLTQ